MSTLLKRLDKHFTTCAAAAAGVAAIGTAANAAIVYTALNHVVPNTFDGTYLNVETGAFSDVGSSAPAGWDLNPYGTSTTAISFFQSSTAGTGGATASWVRLTGAAGPSNLTAGTLIGGASTFATSGVSYTTGAGAWAANSTHILGFRFVDSGGNIRYGWMRMSVGANFATRTIIDFAWENTGGSIEAGAVPGPAGLAALAMGAVGIRSRRRK